MSDNQSKSTQAVASRCAVNKPSLESIITKFTRFTANHWFMQWLDAQWATSPNLNQWWPNSFTLNWKSLGTISLWNIFSGVIAWTISVLIISHKTSKNSLQISRPVLYKISTTFWYLILSTTLIAYRWASATHWSYVFFALSHRYVSTAWDPSTEKT